MSVLMRVFYSLMILVDGHSCRWSNVHQATRPRGHFSPQVVILLDMILAVYFVHMHLVVAIIAAEVIPAFTIRATAGIFPA